MEMSRRYQRLQQEHDAALEDLRRCQAAIESLQQDCSHLKRQLSDSEAETASLEKQLAATKVLCIRI